MSATLERGSTAGPGRDSTNSGDLFVRVNEILDICHCLPPTGVVTTRTTPEDLDDCLILRQRQIQQYRFERDPRHGLRWVRFADIVHRFSEMQADSARRDHIDHYDRDDVFAPVKVVLAETNRPIRAAITYEPVYPWQNKLAVPHPGKHLWLVYAAVAVLNSEHAQRSYDDYLEAHPTRSRTPHGLKMAALRQIPVARKDFTFTSLSEVAQLAHQMTSLYRAREECLPEISGRRRVTAAGDDDALRHYNTVFEEQIRGVGSRLEHAIPDLLGLGNLGEVEETELLARGRRYLEGGDPQLPLEWPEVLGRLPPQPPVTLLSMEDDQRLRRLTERDEPGDSEEIESLLLLRHWQGVINHRPPFVVRGEARDEALAA